MAKKGNKTIDENFMKEIISQGLPIKQEDVSVKERTIPAIKVEQSSSPIIKNNSMPTPDLQNNIANYEETFFHKMELPDRRSVYVSNSTHEKLTRIATILGMGKATVSSYVESIIQHHFDKHKDEINELYKKKWRNYYDTQIDYYPCHTLLFAFITLVWKKPKGYKTNK